MYRTRAVHTPTGGFARIGSLSWSAEDGSVLTERSRA